MTRASLKRYWTSRGVIPRWQYLLVYAAIVASGAVGFYLTSRQATRNHRAITALCILRRDLKDREISGERFLAVHPHGIPGITARTIRLSIAGNRRTIRALSILHC